MPKITEIYEVLAAPNNCPFDSVAGVVSVAYPATEKTGKRGPYLIQNIELRDRTPGSTQRIKVFMMGLPEISKDLKGQQIIFTTGGKSKDNLARADNEWEGKTTLQLTAKGGTTWDILRDGVPVSPPAAQPPPAAQQRHQEAPNDHLAGDPTPQAQTHAQQAAKAPESTPQARADLERDNDQAVRYVKGQMLRQANAYAICLNATRYIEEISKFELPIAERLTLATTLFIGGERTGLWADLPATSLDKKPTPPPAEAPAPVAAPPPPVAQPPQPKVQKPKLPSPGEAGYDIDSSEVPF